MCDQLRWDALSCTDDWCDTPNIDSIAKEGMIFTDCVTNSPVCIPARVSLATGHYPHTHGMWNNGQYDMPEESNTWMQTFKDMGYRTSLFGKTHLHRHEGDLRDREHLIKSYGLDDFDEIGGPRASANVMSHMTECWEKNNLLEAYRDDYEDRFKNYPHVVRASALPLEHYADVYVGQKAKAYLQSYNLNNPWMCWVSFGGPHEPWDTPEPYASMFNAQDMPEPRVAPKDMSEDSPEGCFQTGENKKALSKEQYGLMRADYAGNVKLIDDQIGEIVTTIKERGEWDNTIIVLSSDHGEMNGDAGRIYKSNFMDGAVRIPLIFRVPGVTHGTKTSASSELMDVGPTLIDLAGGTVDYEQFAVSQKKVITGEVVKVRPFSISEFQNEIMIYDEEYKGVMNKNGEIYLLFFRKNDELERHNLAGHEDYKEIERKLKAKIVEFKEQNDLSKG